MRGQRVFRGVRFGKKYKNTGELGEEKIRELREREFSKEEGGPKVPINKGAPFGELQVKAEGVSVQGRAKRIQLKKKKENTETNNRGLLLSFAANFLSVSNNQHPQLKFNLKSLKIFQEASTRS